MNHVREGVAHKSSNGCVYQAQYDNRYFTCKVCYDLRQYLDYKKLFLEEIIKNSFMFLLL